MVNVHQSHLIWKDLVQHYKFPPFCHNHADVYGVFLDQLQPEQVQHCSLFCTKFMEMMEMYNWCCSEPMTNSTKIMKLNLAFASDTELQCELATYECIDPVNSNNFLEYYKHIVSTCAKLEAEDIVLTKVKLDPETSNKKQLIHQADLSEITAPDVDFDAPDPTFIAPFPSCDVDGGDTLNFSDFSVTLNFSDDINNVTTNETDDDNPYDHENDDDDPHNHETDDDHLGNEDVCEYNVCDTGMSVIETDDSDLFLCQEICPTFENDIDNENSIPVLTVCDHDVDTGANCGDDTGDNCGGDGDIVGNGDDVPDLLCCICNVDDDSSGDEASDDVNTIDEDTIDGDDGPDLLCCTHNFDDDSSDDLGTIDEDIVGNDDDPPPLFSSPDDDIDDGEEEFLLNNHIPHKWSSFTNGYDKAFQTIDDNIDIIITDLNKFCLFAKFCMSTGLIYKALSLADDTSINTSDDYVLDMLDGEFKLTQNPNENPQML